MGVKDSNEVEALAILEPFEDLVPLISSLIVESDSHNVILWTSHIKDRPWKLQFCLNEINALVSHINVEFRHVLREANGLVDALAK